MEDFIAILRASLGRFGGKVVVEVVTDTYDFKKWLGDKAILNPQLSCFSRHGPSNFHPGVHVFR
jgi:hypothetical protein